MVSKDNLTARNIAQLRVNPFIPFPNDEESLTFCGGSFNAEPHSIVRTDIPTYAEPIYFNQGEQTQ